MKAAFHTLGCKVNAYETEAMKQQLKEKGYEIVPFQEKADVYIINTCTVTNIADRKSRQMLHKAKKMNPKALVVATGCYAQTKGEELQKDEAIDLVIGNNRKKDLIRILKEYEAGRVEDTLIDINQTREYEALSIESTREHTRGFIKVQDGCNQFCTYCMIPFARGRVRSRRPEDVEKEVRLLAASGCREVVLSGIHLSSYGVDLEEGTDLLTLIRRIHSVDGIARIRLGSLEPGIITEAFADALVSLPKVCPHFHLSLQSGCDATLKRMNRRYRAGEYREKCAILRKVYEDPALTTDVITGFPGETAEDFEASRAFVEEIAFFETHIFPYSRREGTKAAAFPDQLTEAVKKERSRVLLELDAKRRREYLSRAIGRPCEVLFEERIEWEGNTYWCGHTREYRRILLASEENLENCLIPVKPVSLAGGEQLLAERLAFTAEML